MCFVPLLQFSPPNPFLNESIWLLYHPHIVPNVKLLVTDVFSLSHPSFSETTTVLIHCFSSNAAVTLSSAILIHTIATQFEIVPFTEAYELYPLQSILYLEYCLYRILYTNLCELPFFITGFCQLVEYSRHILILWQLVKFDFEPAGINGIFITSNPDEIMLQNGSRYEKRKALSGGELFIWHLSLSLLSMSVFVVLNSGHPLYTKACHSLLWMCWKAG